MVQILNAHPAALKERVHELAAKLVVIAGDIARLERKQEETHTALEAARSQYAYAASPHKEGYTLVCIKDASVGLGEPWPTFQVRKGRRYRIEKIDYTFSPKGYLWWLKIDRTQERGWSSRTWQVHPTDELEKALVREDMPMPVQDSQTSALSPSSPS